MAGEVALKSPVPDAAKAEAYFERALAVAHQQQAKSWELRAATSLARLWRDQGKRDKARDLLAPIARCALDPCVLNSTVAAERSTRSPRQRYYCRAKTFRSRRTIRSRGPPRSLPSPVR
jgi:hypothetical protein